MCGGLRLPAGRLRHSSIYSDFFMRANHPLQNVGSYLFQPNFNNLPTYDIITQDYISLGEICQDSNLFFQGYLVLRILSY